MLSYFTTLVLGAIIGAIITMGAICWLLDRQARW